MVQDEPQVPLILKIRVLSDDPSDVRVQREIVEAAREHNIKSLDTARQYACSLTCSHDSQILILIGRTRADLKSILLIMGFLLNSKSLLKFPWLWHLMAQKKRGY
jgi:hypothetical protein